MKTPEDTTIPELQQILSFAQAVIAERKKTTNHPAELIDAERDIEKAITTLKRVQPIYDPSRSRRRGGNATSTNAPPEKDYTKI